MKKKTQQAENTKNSNVLAENQKEKKTKKENQGSKANTANEYPEWTTPEHLDDDDHKDLKRVYELHKEGKFDVAYNIALDLDTIVRDEIPDNIWKDLKGSLFPKVNAVNVACENETEKQVENQNGGVIANEEESPTPQ